VTGRGQMLVRASAAASAVAARALTTETETQSGLPSQPSYYEALRVAGLVTDDPGLPEPTGDRDPREDQEQPAAAAMGMSAAEQEPATSSADQEHHLVPTSGCPDPACAEPVAVAIATVVAELPVAADKVRDVNDYMLRDAYYQTLESEYGPFTAELAADPKGLNARNQLYFSVENPAQAADLRGHTCYCNGPFLGPDYAAIIRNYKHCKAQAPYTTSAVFVVPDWPTADFWPLLHGMKLVRYYPRGTSLFTGAPVPGSTTRTKVGPVRWPVCVLWDPPTPAYQTLPPGPFASVEGNPDAGLATLNANCSTSEPSSKTCRPETKYQLKLTPSGRQPTLVGVREKTHLNNRAHPARVCTYRGQPLH